MLLYTTNAENENNSNDSNYDESTYNVYEDVRLACEEQLIVFFRDSLQTNLYLQIKNLTTDKFSRTEIPAGNNSPDNRF